MQAKELPGKGQLRGAAKAWAKGLPGHLRSFPCLAGRGADRPIRHVPAGRTLPKACPVTECEREHNEHNFLCEHKNWSAAKAS
ncbi:hypothetical protein GCM10009715_22750 [Paeniglutamicibacter psychrophenolicus]